MEEKTKLSGAKQWGIVSAVLLGAIGFTIMQYCCSAFLTLMSETAGMSGAQQGTFNGIQSLAGIFMMLFGAVFAMKLGIKNSFFIGNVLTIVVGGCFYAGSYPALLLGRVFLGLSAGMTVPLRASILSIAFGTDKKKTTFATGLIGCGAFLGRYFGLAIAFPLLNLVGSWQMACLLLGLFGVLAGLIWFVFFPGAEEYQNRSKGTPALKGTVDSWKQAWKYPAIRKFLIYFTCSGFSGLVFNAFSVSLIIYKHGLDAGVASQTVAYSGIMGMCGALAGGFVASRSKVKNVIIPCELISGFCMIACAMMNTPSIAVLTVLISLHGFCNAAQSTNNVSLLYKQPGITPQEMTGGLSLIMAVFYLGGYVSSQLFGIIYPKIGMDKGILIWSIPVLLGGIICCTIKEPNMNELQK